MIDHGRREDTVTTSGSVQAVATGPRLGTAPVLGVLVCHDGRRWLPDVLAALRNLTVCPRHVLAVDTGSTDGSEELLADAASGADAVLDGVLTLGATTGFGDAVAEALAEATERWGDPGTWLWLLHDDSAPEPDCLETLLHSADVDAGAAVLGPLGLDWDDRRLVVDDGLSLDASGQPQTGMGPAEIDPALRMHRSDGVFAAAAEDDDSSDSDGGDSDGGDSDGEQEDPGVSAALQVSEVLAVSTACALVRREVFEHLDGFDANLPVACDDLDFGWRVNAHGGLVLCVPGARMRHASAVRRGLRDATATPDGWPGTFRAAQRANGVRTFLVNAPWWSFVVGVPRLAVITLLRAVGYVVLRRGADVAAEIVTLRRLLTGGFGLLAGRRRRRESTPEPHRARGLLTSRTTRLRNGLDAAFAGFVRDRVRRDLVLGRPTRATPLGLTSVRGAAGVPAAVGPAALPSGALGQAGAVRQAGTPRRVAGLRRPSGTVVVPVVSVDDDAEPPGPEDPGEETPGEEAEAQRRPSPVPRAALVERAPEAAASEPAAPDDLVVVPVDRRLLARELLLTPPVVLVVALTAFALVLHGVLAEAPRFGAGLHGGRLLPAADLADVWSRYLAAWHPAHAGTGSPAPAGLLVLGVLGAVLAPFGGPPVVLSVLMLFGVPLAGMSAYAATRSVPVSRTSRALAAAAYAVLPVATTAAAHGRLGVVVAHILVPPILTGIASVVGLSRMASTARDAGHWLGTACLTAAGLAVLGAFDPLMHVVLLVVTLVGFVLVPAAARRARRRFAGLSALVVLPVACLLPWPVAVVRNPEILVHGLGARVVEERAGWSLLALNAGGGPAAWAGALVVLAAVVALLLGRIRAVLPGVVVALLGWIAAFLVNALRVPPVWGGPDTVGWAGGPLVLTAAGLLWSVLAAVHSPNGRSLQGMVPGRRLTAVVLVAGVVGLTSAAALAGRAGPLSARTTTATPALTADLAKPGYLLATNSGPQPARFTRDGVVRYGTDSIAPAPSAPSWLREVEADLLSGERERVRTALASAAARGAAMVALPAPAAERVRDLASDLVSDNGHLGDGRSVLRLLLPSTPVELLGPALAKTARRAPAPSPQSRTVEVTATLPHVAVRVSAGGAGRVLVLAAENEPGWYAEVNGEPAPLATAWGHQVAVPLPEGQSKVVITYTQVPRTTLLAVQAAAILFVLIGALPTRRPRRG